MPGYSVSVEVYNEVKKIRLPMRPLEEKLDDIVEFAKAVQGVRGAAWAFPLFLNTADLIDIPRLIEKARQEERDIIAAEKTDTVTDEPPAQMSLTERMQEYIDRDPYLETVCDPLDHYWVGSFGDATCAICLMSSDDFRESQSQEQ